MLVKDLSVVSTRNNAEYGLGFIFQNPSIYVIPIYLSSNEFNPFNRFRCKISSKKLLSVFRKIAIEFFEDEYKKVHPEKSYNASSIFLEQFSLVPSYFYHKGHYFQFRLNAVTDLILTSTCHREISVYGCTPGLKHKHIGQIMHHISNSIDFVIPLSKFYISPNDDSYSLLHSDIVILLN